MLRVALLFVLYVLPIDPVSRPHARIGLENTNSLSLASEIQSIYEPIRTDFSDYIWPTDAGRIVTSVFAEYRTTHFHGGIDISTGDDTGYRVFAARDGYVARIIVGPSGYGKMLWLRHADGYYTTYAHLRNFNAVIDAFVKKEQQRLERYPLDIECSPSDFPVKKGELVAYSGETGTGSPHLHFEIRDKNKNFINPLLCEQFTFHDDSLPRYYRLAVTPLGEFSFVENSFRSNITEFRNPPKGSVTLTETLHVTGSFGFAVDARDRINGSRFRSGVYRHKLFLDDSLIYSVQFDRAPSSDGFPIGLYYDLDMIAEEGGKIAKLYMDSPARLPFYYPVREDAGTINTTNFPVGLHTFKIVTSDYFGNTSELGGTLLFSHTRQYSPSLKKKSIKRAPSSLKHEIEPDFIRVLLIAESTPTALPSIVLHEANATRSLQVFPLDNNSFTATFRPLESSQDKRTVTAQYESLGRLRSLTDEISVHPILPKKSSHIFVDDRRLQITTDSFSVYKPLLLEVEKEDDGHYSLLPRRTVLNRGLRVRMKAERDSKRALYFRRGSRWGLLSTTFDEDYLVGELERTLGEIAILTDAAPPSVTRLTLPLRYAKRPHVVSFTVRDNLSGVEYKDLKLYIDEVFAIPEIDGERRRVTHRCAEPLTRGSHTVVIRTKDRVGNERNIRRTFFVR